MILRSFLAAFLISVANAEAISERERIAFSGVDTLQVFFRLGGEPPVQEETVRTKFELVLRSAGIPIGDTGSDLRIDITSLLVPEPLDIWLCFVEANLWETATVWRNDAPVSLMVSTWRVDTFASGTSTKEAREDLLRRIREIAEKVSNLYLATR